MPKTPIDYSKTIIYKLVHKEDYDNANIYIGSTTQFTKRKAYHKGCCNNENIKSYSNMKYQYIRDNGGWENWSIIEIEKYPCNDNNEATSREQYWISYFKTTLTTKKAYIPDEERENYYNYNKDRLLEQKKYYHIKHRENILEYKKIYNENNKEDRKIYYEEHKDEILAKRIEKITCECGCIITRHGMTRHKKSSKHLNSLNIN